MKKVKLFVFSILLFLICVINVHAAETYSWACRYEYTSGDLKLGVQFQVSKIPEDVLTNSVSLNQTGKKYVSTKYYSKKQGEYVSISSGGTTDFPGHKTGWGKFYPTSSYTWANDIDKAFTKNSFANNGVTCPPLYITNHCTSGSGYFVTYDSKYSDSTTGSACDNMKMGSSNPVCQTGSGKSLDCGKMITSSPTGSGTGPGYCEYKTESSYAGKSTFKLKYDSQKGLTFDPGTGSLQVEWVDYDALNNLFKNSRSCPANVSCAIPSIGNWGSKIKIGTNAGFKGNSKCGKLVNNNGQKVTDDDEYVGQLLLNGTDFDISDQKLSCRQLLGENLYKVLHLFITALRIAGAIIAIISGMLAFVPAVASNNADALKKATKKCIILAVVLVVIGIFPVIVGVIGKIAGFDLTCLK